MTYPPTRPTALLTLLRNHTSARHEALDAGIRFCDADGDTRRYAAFLRGTLAALAPLERLQAFLPGLGLELRRAALRSDLAALNACAAASGSVSDAPEPRDLSEAYGCAYVIEGSALGGAVIARQVKALLPGAPTSFLELHGSQLGERWRAFLAQLAEHDHCIDDAARARACASACAMFDHYTAAYRGAEALADV